MNELSNMILSRNESRGAKSIWNVILGFTVFLMLSIVYSSVVSAEANPNDFEWKVPTPVLENENDQIVMGMYEDIQTNSVYTIIQNYNAFTGYPDQEHFVVVNRFNTTTHEFDHSFVRDNPGYNNDYIVHGGRWYVFHTSEGLLHMRINNSTIDTMKWVYDYSGYRLIGVHNGELFFIMFTGEYGHTVELFSVNVTTFSWTREVIFQLIDHGPGRDNKIRHVFKNGNLILARSELVQQPDYKEVWLYEYDTVTEISKSPRRMWTSDDSSFGRWDLDIDSESNFHLLLGNSSVWRLSKLAPSMALMEWTELEGKPGDTRKTHSALFIMIDGSDTLQIVGSMFYNTTENMLLMSWTLQMNYTSGVLRKTIFEGRTSINSFSENGMISFSDGEVIVCFVSLIDDKFTDERKEVKKKLCRSGNQPKMGKQSNYYRSLFYCSI